MSILTGPEIEYRIRLSRDSKARGYTAASARFLPWIDVEPWRPEMCGPNSLDVHLGDTLVRYEIGGVNPDVIDPANPPAVVDIPAAVYSGKDRPRGWLLEPGVLYLGATAELVELHGVAAMLTGRSSLGRLGVDCHISAGLIDDGFAGNITLEIRVVHPIILRPGMRFAQLVFEPVQGERRPYRGRYQNDAGPVASRFHFDGGR